MYSPSSKAFIACSIFIFCKKLPALYLPLRRFLEGRWPKVKNWKKSIPHPLQKIPQLLLLNLDEKRFLEGWGRCGGICCIQSESNEEFGRITALGWGNNPWKFWILGNFTHQTAWHRLSASAASQLNYNPKVCHDRAACPTVFLRS